MRRNMPKDMKSCNLREIYLTSTEKEYWIMLQKQDWMP